MSIGIVGYGIQGKKRAKLLKSKLKFVYDPFSNNKNIKYLNKNKLNHVDSIFLCVPDKNKIKLIKKFLELKKNILVKNH